MLRAINEFFTTRPPDVTVKKRHVETEIIEAKNESGETVLLEMPVENRVHDPWRAIQSRDAPRTDGTQQRDL
jgi:hypothetical protein